MEYEVPGIQKPQQLCRHHRASRSARPDPLLLLYGRLHSPINNATEDLIHSPSPGFPVTLTPRYVFGEVNRAAILDTVRLDLGLVRALTESGCVSLVFHLQPLVILSRSTVRAFSREACTRLWGAAEIEIGLKF